ncbi:MAG: M56 family metallopeptidase [Bacteroidaceae bacterium]|nr:M56 family metallopeptidase [Bacteroidaceae bacterium]
MGALTLYAIKSSLTLALLYLPYALMLRRETFFRFNRAMLLCIVVLSLLLPCLDVHVWDNGLATPFEPQRQAISSVVLPTLIVGSSESAAADVPADHTAVVWSTLLVYIYIIGVLFFVLWKAVGLIRLIRFIPRGCLWTDKQEGATIYCHADKVSPFSWMRSIVIGSPLPTSPEGEDIVLAHELAHVRMRHSWDALFLTFVEVLQWFNPCIWMLDASLREVHEYEADDAVLRRGISARDYQLLLIEKAVARTPYPMVNGFRHSLLKKRITMMTKKKSPRWARLKVLYAVPLTLIALGAMASQQMAEKVETPIAKKTPTAEVKRQMKAAPGTLRVVVDGQEMSPQEAMKAVEGKEIRNELTPENELRITTTEKSKEKALPLCVLVDGKPMGDITASDEMRKVEKYVKADEIGSLSVTNNEKVAKEIYKDFDKQKYSGIVIIETKKDNKEVEADGDDVVDVPQICAEFRDSLTNNNIYAWLSQNMRYPKEAQDKNIEGRVSIQFIIEKDGSIDEVKTLRSPSEILSAEAERVVKAMPKWKPAMHKGKPVRMRYVLPVLFKLPTKEQVATVAVDEVKGN